MYVPVDIQDYKTEEVHLMGRKYGYLSKRSSYESVETQTHYTNEDNNDGQ